MDLRKLKTLIDLVSDSNISELEITEAEGKVRIVKADPRLALPASSAQSTVMMTVPQPTVAAAANAATPLVVEEAAAPVGHVVKSPMVGTFYRSASPGSKTFADLGSPVKEDHERDRGRQVGHGHAHPVRKRPGGRVRTAAVHHRVSGRACSKKY
jgi:acetyl-CoA carboxylase biotin carboxyl carrier protein